MASLSWKKLIPNISVLDTQKKYFNQYLFKIELLAYGSRSINSPTGIERGIQNRMDSYRRINYAGSWHAEINRQLTHADIGWLEWLKEQKYNVPEGMKFRIEEPKVQLYSVTEDALIQFVNQIPKRYQHYVQSLTRPVDDQQLAMLEAGIKIVKNPPPYRFKVNFRDGKYQPETKQQLLNYLTALDDSVKIPERCRSQLDKEDFGYVWDCYVYTNDDGIITFMRLIHPNLIRSITEMASVAQINTDNKEI